MAIRETHKLSGAFASSEEVEKVRKLMESWSELAFDALQRVAGEPLG